MSAESSLMFPLKIISAKGVNWTELSWRNQEQLDKGKKTILQQLNRESVFFFLGGGREVQEARRSQDQTTVQSGKSFSMSHKL